ncbi:MAG: hypothetical protein ACRELC_13025, partial [Gemmatimonadota bacterium]
LIGWSTYGRAYAFAILFAVLSFGCLARALDGSTGETRWRRLYVVCALATAYSSVLAGLTLLPVQAAAVAWRTRAPDQRRAWATSALALGAGLLPLGALLVAESRVRDPLAWLWKPDLALVRRVGGELTAGPAFFGDAGAGLAGAIAAAVVAVVVAGSVLAWRGKWRLGWRTAMIVGWTAFPPVLLFVASQWRPMFWGRYLGIVLPALALLLAALLVRMPRVLGIVYGIAVGATFLAASLATSAPFNDFSKKADWVEMRRAPEDPLVLYPIEQLPPLAYYGRSLRVDGLVPAEEWNDTTLPPNVHGYRRDYDWGDSPVGPPPADQLSQLASRTGSVVVLTYPNLVAGIPLGWAEARGCAIERVSFPGLTAVEIVGCTPASRAS